MSINNKKKSKKKISSKSCLKNFELPLNNGFKRAIIRQEDDRLVSVYYAATDGTYLKDISDVSDWIENNEPEGLLSCGNFNFVAKRYTSNDNEFIIDYNSVPSEIQDYVIHKKKSIAPIIITVGNDDTFSIKSDSNIESKSSKKRSKSEDASTETLVFEVATIESSLIKHVPREDVSIDNNNVDDNDENNIFEDISRMDMTEGIKMNDTKEENNKMEGIITEDSTKDEDRIEHTKEENNEMEGVTIEDLVKEEGRIEVSKKEGCEKEGIIIEDSSKEGENSLVEVSAIEETVKEMRLQNKGEEIYHLMEGLRSDNSTMVVSIANGNTNNCNAEDNTMESVSIKCNQREGIEMYDGKDNHDNMDGVLMEADENSMTLSLRSMNKEDAEGDAVRKPIHPFEFPLEAVNKNNLIELGTNCHIDRIRDITEGGIDSGLMKSMHSYCGNHCAFDTKGCPRVAFECDVCLILWHTDCTGHRWLTIGSSSLIICDNCYLIQTSLNIAPPVTFCDVEELFSAEFKPDPNNQGPLSIPAKLESIFKLCKIKCILEYKKVPINDTAVQKKCPKKEAGRDNSNEFRYFIKAFINHNSILSNLKEDAIRLTYSINEINRMANIFADSSCAMLLNDEMSEVFVSRITIKDGQLIIPVSRRITRNGKAMFYTFEWGQDKDCEYIDRSESLKSAMLSSYHIANSRLNIVPHKELQTQLYNQPYKIVKRETQKQLYNQTSYIPKDPHRQTQPIITPRTVSLSNVLVRGPLTSTAAVVPPLNRPPISVSGLPTIVSVCSQNLPKNAIPISRNQIQNISNLIKIRKRKQDFCAQKVSLMETSTPTIQYHHLVDLPFFIIEKIMTSANLSTLDRLNCRLASRVLKCVVDGGQVWSKVVIYPGLITGLQTMFDFFSRRNVKKMTFKIDFQESFGIEFFTSFLGRLKLYPDYFHLENVSVKLSGLGQLSTKFSLSIQDILSYNKSLKRLSVSSDEQIRITMGKSLYLTSDSLEILKLKNIENMSNVLRTHGQYTPKLRSVRCGDWSRIVAMERCTLSHITSLRMDFTEYVNLTDLSSFSMLISLESLVISRPRINESLKNLLGHILLHRSLKYFLLETEVGTKEQLGACIHFGSYFPNRIRRIRWKLYLSAFLLLLEPNIRKKIKDFMPTGVEISVFSL